MIMIIMIMIIIIIIIIIIITIIKGNYQWHIREVALRPLCPDRIGIWKCCFLRRENRSTWRKNSRSKIENQQQTQPSYDVGSGNRTRVILMGGECSHHCVRHRCALSNDRSWVSILLKMSVISTLTPHTHDIYIDIHEFPILVKGGPISTHFSKTFK